MEKLAIRNNIYFTYTHTIYIYIYHDIYHNIHTYIYIYMYMYTIYTIDPVVWLISLLRRIGVVRKFFILQL